jgi:hypothetical protein
MNAQFAVAPAEAGAYGWIRIVGWAPAFAGVTK